jgi:antitoxin (DNA-binding transcriptional repressor) of toxin-antitoxin stability system
MALLHVTEAELVRNIASVLDRVQSGEEIVIERNAKPRRRLLSEIMAALPENSAATLDPDFAKDVQSFIDNHREPLNPPIWD